MTEKREVWILRQRRFTDAIKQFLTQIGGAWSYCRELCAAGSDDQAVT